MWNPLTKHYIVPSKVRVKPKYRNQIDVFDCLQLCADDANCKSVDYYYGAKKCWMWSISMNDEIIRRDFYSFRPNSNYDHYEYMCEGEFHSFLNTKIPLRLIYNNVHKSRNGNSISLYNAWETWTIGICPKQPSLLNHRYTYDMLKMLTL